MTTDTTYTASSDLPNKEQVICVQIRYAGTSYAMLSNITRKIHKVLNTWEVYKDKG